MIRLLQRFFKNAFKNDISEQAIEILAAQARAAAAGFAEESITEESLKQMTKAQILEKATEYNVKLSKTLTKNQMIEEFIKTIKEK